MIVKAEEHVMDGNVQLRMIFIDDEAIREKIVQRRKQILVHSAMYYEMGESIISDQTWDKWARELYDLQSRYPDIAKDCFLAEEFSNFDACSGYYLPLYLPWVRAKAAELLNYHKRMMG